MTFAKDLTDIECELHVAGQKNGYFEVVHMYHHWIGERWFSITHIPTGKIIANLIDSNIDTAVQIAEEIEQIGALKAWDSCQIASSISESFPDKFLLWTFPVINHRIQKIVKKYEVDSY